jgi:hypothetical protein
MDMKQILQNLKTDPQITPVPSPGTTGQPQMNADKP